MKLMLKPIALAAALFATACSSVQSSHLTPVAEYTDYGNPDAIVCTNLADASTMVQLAGDNKGDEFTAFVREAFAQRRCIVQTNGQPMRVIAYAELQTVNGPLYVIEYEQHGVRYFASANYFDVSGPMTLIWERQSLVQ